MVYPMLGRMRKIRWNKEQLKRRFVRLNDQSGYGSVLGEGKVSKIVPRVLVGKLGDYKWACPVCGISGTSEIRRQRKSTFKKEDVISCG